MLITQNCVDCIVNQSLKVASAIGADEKLKQELYLHVENLSKDFSFLKSPPVIASSVYKDMAQIAKKEDLYDEVKKISTQKAQSFLPFLKQKLELSTDKFSTAIKIAVAGNVIDLAAEVEFDLADELDKVFDTPFSFDDTKKLQAKLQKAKNVVILGDNVGEHIFDYLFIEVLKEIYSDINYTYMVRGTPIINDVTMKEAKECGFDKLCNLVDSGVDTPGFEYGRATDEAKKLFDEADVIISKGMGNYECLTPVHVDTVFFLLKVKCSVVATSLGKEVGDIICYNL